MYATMLFGVFKYRYILLFLNIDLKSSLIRYSWKAHLDTQAVSVFCDISLLPYLGFCGVIYFKTLQINILDWIATCISSLKTTFRAEL